MNLEVKKSNLNELIAFYDKNKTTDEKVSDLRYKLINVLQKEIKQHKRN